MKPSSSASPTSAATMALTTTPAGPSRWMRLKMDPIAQSKSSVGAILRTLLEGAVARHVLAVADLKAQAPAVGLRSEAADLVDQREIFRADGEEDVAAERAAAGPMLQRE